MQAQGFSHGDAAPRNIVVQYNEDVHHKFTLTDLGIACKLGDLSQIQIDDLIFFWHDIKTVGEACQERR